MKRTVVRYVGKVGGLVVGLGQLNYDAARDAHLAPRVTTVDDDGTMRILIQSMGVVL